VIRFTWLYNALIVEVTVSPQRFFGLPGVPPSSHQLRSSTPYARAENWAVESLSEIGRFPSHQSLKIFCAGSKGPSVRAPQNPLASMLQSNRGSVCVPGQPGAVNRRLSSWPGSVACLVVLDSP